MYLISHHHADTECRAAFAAWRGFASPLRGRPTTSSCTTGDHRVWWTVKAPNAAAALALLPPFVAARSEATPVREVAIP